MSFELVSGVSENSNQSIWEGMHKRYGNKPIATLAEAQRDTYTSKYSRKESMDEYFVKNIFEKLGI